MTRWAQLQFPPIGEAELKHSLASAHRFFSHLDFDTANGALRGVHIDNVKLDISDEGIQYLVKIGQDDMRLLDDGLVAIRRVEMLRAQKNKDALLPNASAETVTRNHKTALSAIDENAAAHWSRSKAFEIIQGVFIFMMFWALCFLLLFLTFSWAL